MDKHRRMYYYYLSGSFTQTSVEANLQLLLLILVPAIGFGGWPVITRLAGATSAAWTNVILMSVTTALMFVYYGRSLHTELLSIGQGTSIVVAAALNSVALVLFGMLIQKHPQYVPIAQALMPMVSLFGAWAFLGARVSAPQVGCMAAACLFIAGAGYFTPNQ